MARCRRLGQFGTDAQEAVAELGVVTGRRGRGAGRDHSCSRVAGLLEQLALRGRRGCLAQIDVTAASSIPLVGLNVFPSRTMLQIQFALTIK